MRPRIEQTDDVLGFHWVDEDGNPVALPELVLIDDEPERLPPTHLEALDDVLIDAAGRFGELLGGGRDAVDPAEQGQLRSLHRVLDRLNHEYSLGAAALGMPVEVRGGQIVGTSALIAIRARMALGTAGPTPFAGQLDDPRIGVVAGRGVYQAVSLTEAWRGGRWIVLSEDGPRFPLTLSMLMFDSSGTNGTAAQDEHRAALRELITAVASPDADPFVAAGALDWLLYDWLMAHRESPDSGAIEIGKDHVDDAAMIVAAAAAAATARSASDHSLLRVRA